MCGHLELRDLRLAAHEPCETDRLAVKLRRDDSAAQRF
jgi:hypothetical protein